MQATMSRSVRHASTLAPLTKLAILLVGGFGTSRYLHKRLNEAYKTAGTKVLQTNGGYSYHLTPVMDLD